MPALAGDGEEGARGSLAVAEGSTAGGCVGDLDAVALLSGVRRLPEGTYNLGHDVSCFKPRSTPRMSHALASGANADDRSRSNAWAKRRDPRALQGPTCPAGCPTRPLRPSARRRSLLFSVDGACERRHHDRLRGLRRTSRDRPQHGLPSEAKGPASQVVLAARSPRARLLGAVAQGVEGRDDSP